MKWLIRLLLTAALLLASAGFSLWLASPWLITEMAGKAAAGKNVVVRIEKPGRPTFTSTTFDALEISSVPATTLPGNTLSNTYSIRIDRGKLAYRFLSNNFFEAVFSLLTGSAVPVDFDLSADSLHATFNDGDIAFTDWTPQILGKGQLSNNGNTAFFQPDSFTYAVRGADVTKEKLSLEGIDYTIAISREKNWGQAAEKLLVRRLLANGSATPLSNFEAVVALTPETFSSGHIVLTNCTVDLLTWKASTDRIVHNIPSRETSFTLQLEKLRLEEIPGFKRADKPYGTGTVSGKIPMTIRDTIITIADASIRSEPGTKLTYYSDEGAPLLHIDLAGSGAETVRKFNAVITLQASADALQGIALSDISCFFLGGHVSTKKIHYDLNKQQSSFTVRMRNVPLRNTLKLLGDFSGSFNAPMNGTIPFSITQSGFSMQNVHLFSAGTGEIKHTPKEQPNNEEKKMFGSDTMPGFYSFSSPDMRINRTASGKTEITFRLKSLEGRKGNGSYKLDNLKGSLTFGQDRSQPSTIILEDFTANALGGSIATDRVAYDFKENRADFTLSVKHVPIQELINHQGLTKVTTSGTLTGNLPIKLDGPLFRIHQGKMSAEKEGRIIYTASEEETAMAHESLKTAYSALSDFHYNELQASIDMEPDGQSVIGLQVKGSNPSFQEGRPVHFNLNVEQNLLDLLRSLTISTNIEEAISEKAFREKAN